MASNAKGNGGESRRIALDLLEAVWQKGRPLDEAVAAERRLAKLPPRDRAFVRNLAATCLRRQGQLDALIEARLDKPLKPALDRIRNILRLGAAQLVFLQMPAHAAVSTTVDLAKSKSDRPFRALINAVLRRIADAGSAALSDQEAGRLNTPDWVWDSWSTAYGVETAGAIAEAQLADPPLDLTLKTGEDSEAWAERLDAQVLPGGSLRLAAGTGDIARLPGYAEGAWWVQDLAATLPALLLGSVAGRPVLELCAAPGGKTAQLAAAGAEVIALDQSPARLRRLEQNLQRLRLSAATVAADAGAWQPPAPAERILLDAPCSATGTLRRHPDIARLRRPKDIATLTGVQDRLLKAAAEMLAPGGTLVYAVCSLQPEEGPERIAALLAARPDMARVPVTAVDLHGLGELVTAEGDLRSLPCHLSELGGLDGFYACRLRRQGA